MIPMEWMFQKVYSTGIKLVSGFLFMFRLAIF